EDRVHSDAQRNGEMEENNARLSSLALSSSDRVECMQFGKELPSNLQAYYTPPSSFVIPEIQAQANLTSSSSSPQQRTLLFWLTSVCQIT
ncbi:hypothetical protein ACTXT7_015888, partial [Hymenolepis weldensis]